MNGGERACHLLYVALSSDGTVTNHLTSATKLRPTNPNDVWTSTPLCSVGVVREGLSLGSYYSSRTFNDDVSPATTCLSLVQRNQHIGKRHAGATAGFHRQGILSGLHGIRGVSASGIRHGDRRWQVCLRGSPRHGSVADSRDRDSLDGRSDGELGCRIYQKQGTIASKYRANDDRSMSKNWLTHSYCSPSPMVLRTIILQFPGSPVLVGKDRVKKGGPLHAIVINNKVSNVCSGGDGIADAELVCEAVAKALDLPGGASTVLPSSTGVIGWRLPAKELANDVVPKAVENLQTGSALNAAKAICTTDRFPKVRSQTLSSGARLVGIAKGAGMIEPNMATMLSYIMTDAVMPKESLQSMLTEAVNGSFNSISVDGDESTSDTCVLAASNLVDGTDTAEFEAALQTVCRGLAADLVRNGEGTGHVMRVQIDNFPGTDHEARRLGRHVVNSPLFKCAVAGNDPNTGRLAGAIGSFMGKFKNAESVTKMSLTLGGRTIFQNGKFVLEGQEVEEALSNHMEDAQYDEHADYPPHQKFVEIGIDFGQGTGPASAVVFGSDLTAEYVSINGDYRS